MLDGLSSGSCNGGHCSIGRGAGPVEIVCNGCVKIL